MNADGAITWGELLTQTAQQLGNHQEARWLCEHASGVDGGEFDSAATELVNERAGDALRAMVARRLAGEPLQYVMSRWAFRHLDVLVDPRVLIPRPETELVAQTALDLAKIIHKNSAKKVCIADLGTGSGVIGLSIASEMPRESTRVWLTDISVDALDVARANLAGLGLVDADVSLAHGDWFGAFENSSDVTKNSFDLIVSNPPYIADGDASVEKIVRDYEPSIALFAGSDGLDAYRRIISEANNWLAHNGWLVLEIGHQQGVAIAEMLESNGFCRIEIHQDFTSRDRLAIAQRKSDR